MSRPLELDGSGHDIAASSLKARPAPNAARLEGGCHDGRKEDQHCERPLRQPSPPRRC